MDTVIEYAPFLIPLVIAQLALAVVSVIHVIRHPQYRFGNKALWIVIVVLFQFIGPACYFVFGRGKD